MKDYSAFQGLGVEEMRRIDEEMRRSLDREVDIEKVHQAVAGVVVAIEHMIRTECDGKRLTEAEVGVMVAGETRMFIEALDDPSDNESELIPRMMTLASTLLVALACSQGGPRFDLVSDGRQDLLRALEELAPKTISKEKLDAGAEAFLRPLREHTNRGL